MTTPSPDQQGQPAPRKSKFKVGDVVEFTHRDVLLGRDHTEIGVVVVAGAESEAVGVRPLRDHTVHVDPAQVRAASSGDVG